MSMCPTAAAAGDFLPSSEAAEEALALHSMYMEKFMLMSAPESIATEIGLYSLKCEDSHAKADAYISKLTNFLQSAEKATGIAPLLYSVECEIFVNKPPLVCKVDTIVLDDSVPHSGFHPVEIEPNADGHFPAYIRCEMSVSKDDGEGTTNSDPSSLPPTQLLMKRTSSHDGSHGVRARIFPVYYLPPVKVVVLATQDYPSRAPPYLDISGCWVSPAIRDVLVSEFKRIFEESAGLACLFQYLDWLQHESYGWLQTQAAVWRSIHLQSPSCKPISLPHNPAIAVKLLQQHAMIATIPLDATASASCGCWFHAAPTLPPHFASEQIILHDMDQCRRQWLEKEHDCRICLGMFVGADALELRNCSHTFCKGCIREYIEAAMTSGRVVGLGCPECNDEVTHLEWRQAFGIAHIDRFLRFENLSLQSMSEGVVTEQCPRCEGIMLREPSSDNVHIKYVTKLMTAHLTHPTKRRDMRMCVSCMYTLCGTCGDRWHGGSPCIRQFKSVSDALRDAESEGFPDERLDGLRRYERLGSAADEGSSTAAASGAGNPEYARRWAYMLSKDFGGQSSNTFKIGFNIMESDKVWHAAARRGGDIMDALRAALWVALNTRPCPKCKNRVEKYIGCNKVHCTVCDTSFCWLCGSAIQGYDHFYEGHDTFDNSSAIAYEVTEHDVLKALKLLA